MILPSPPKLTFTLWSNGFLQSRDRGLTVPIIVIVTLLCTQFLHIPPFRPIQVLYENSFLPLLIAPFNLPSKPTVIVCRVLQLIFLVRTSTITFSVSNLYAIHLIIMLPRIGLGFVFNRAVGWQFPSLFIHSAG